MIFGSQLLLPVSFIVLLCGQAVAQGIYTCVDAKGRKITSDRPITECMDRAQKEISPAGTVKRILMPAPSPQEQAVLEEKEKLEADERAKAAKDKLRDRALLQRYPDRASHDKERTAVLEPVNDIIKTATKRAEDLATQRSSITTELEYYKSSPGNAPTALKRRLDEADVSMAAQKRMLAEKEAEKKRITERFDTEMAKLKPQWDVAASSSAAAAAGVVKKP